MRKRIGDDIDRAREVIRNGGLVAIPTETVYGLAADADDDRAVERIFAAKGRPPDHPLIVHLASSAPLDDWTWLASDDALHLADVCWPGPLTIVCKRSDRVTDLVTGGRSTVALRSPAHEMTLELLRRIGNGGLAAPSANRFGRVSPTTAQHVIDDLGIAVDYVLDGGPCPIGVESTIVDCTTDPPQVLRHGGLPVDVIEQVLGGALGEARGPSRAPGMLASHYAPACEVVVVADPAEATVLHDELTRKGGRVVVIDRRDDLVMYARTLYSAFREAEATGTDLIVAVEPPAVGLGHAIRDRLAKAAAPRH